MVSLNLRLVLVMALVVFTMPVIAAERPSGAVKKTAETESVDRYTRQGSRYYHKAQYPEAIGAFQDALLLIRRIEGVRSIRQLEIVDWLTVSYIQNREAEKADAQQRFYHYLNLVNLGENNPLMLAPMLKLANWYRLRGQLDNALFAFEDALTLIDRAQLNELEKLEPMRGLSYVMTRQQGICCAVKQDLAKQAMAFSLSRNIYADDAPRLLSTMQQMAGWLISTGQLTAAVQTYEQALDLIDANGLHARRRLELLYSISSAKYLSGSCCANEPMTQVLQMVHEPGFSEQDRLSALIHMGNLYTLREQEALAETYYQMAWTAADSERPILEDHLAAPELLGVAGIESVSNAFRRSRADLGFWASINGDLATNEEPVVGSPLGMCRSQAVQLAGATSTRGLSSYLRGRGIYGKKRWARG